MPMRRVWDDMVDPVLGEACFTEWSRLGSINAAVESLNKKGYVNSRNDPMRPLTVNKTAYRWLAFHPEEARQILKDICNMTYTDDDWKKFWVKKSILGVGNIEHEFELWMSEFGINIEVTRRS